MILIRADANEKIGAGHVMRCLTVADALKKRGEEVRFLTADRGADPLIAPRGYETVCLHSDWSAPDDETDALLRAVRELSPSLLLTDSYYITDRYYAALPHTVRTACFDDLNRPSGSVDVLINYNIYASRSSLGHHGSGTKLLLSPRYAPLREEFKDLPPHEIREAAESVFVSAGGSDPENVAGRLINGTCRDHPDVTFHFAVGMMNPRAEELKKKEGGNVVLHIHETDMPRLMRQCDIAVAAAGSTLYELCACGVPTVAYSLADNQRPATEAFERRRLMLNAGDCRELLAFPERVESSLSVLLGSRSERQRLSDAMRRTVDGKGADRIAAALLRAAYQLP